MKFCTSSLLQAAINSPFERTFSKVQCEGKVFYDESVLQPCANSGGIPPPTPPTSEAYSCKFGSRKFFQLCALGGMISCGLTHTLVTPLDLIKCRLQVNAEKYKNLFNGFKLTLQEDGPIGLTKGWAPTLIGYSLQGAFKFGLYEVFKIQYAKMLSEENAYLYRTWIYLAASASAEFFADIALAPWEAMKIKIQTTECYANSIREAVPKMFADEGINAFYKGLVPLWLRQIPYTMMKFVFFERTVELLYKNVVPKPRDECSKSEQLIVTFAAGYIAGVFCAIASHPADVVVSKLNQAKVSSAIEVAKALGFAGMWKGLTPRIIMVGTLTALQWFIYDGVKVLLRIPRPPPPEPPATLKAKMKRDMDAAEKELKIAAKEAEKELKKAGKEAEKELKKAAKATEKEVKKATKEAEKEIYEEKSNND